MRYGFTKPALTPAALEKLHDLSREARGDILKMTTLARSGHPGGSLSSIDIYLAVFSCADIYPEDPYHKDRDRILVSHGHTSPGVYAALANLGFFPRDEVISLFRKTGSPYEGHVERTLPGVEWSSGNLGQGLAAGCGFAIASKHLKLDNNIFVLMSDAEQAKGQVGEARRLAMKHGLGNITVVVDYNHIQLSGRLDDIMPQNIKDNYIADGWKVLEVDGHDYNALYGALREAVQSPGPTVILANTLMGKGIPFMEDDYQYHGMPLNEEEYLKAMDVLGTEAGLDSYRKVRESFDPGSGQHRITSPVMDIDPGEPRTYSPQEKTDNRSAFGKALQDVADINSGRETGTPIIVFDCDLTGSVKTASFAKAHPDCFYQNGVQEHSTATAAGAASSQGLQVFFADFGVFCIDEVYNQQRLNDINLTNLKVIGTHLGLNVGEDGKTHQCIDYLGLTRNLPGFKTIIPADPNQTDRAVRWASTQPGNMFIGMGRSKVPVITDEDGAPFFGNGYTFSYGRADRLRAGRDAAILSYGSLIGRTIEACERLAGMGISVAVYNFSCPNDPDIEMLKEAVSTGRIVTFEDHLSSTGLGAAIAREILIRGWRVDFRCLGLDDYSPSGDFDEIYDLAGLSVDNLVDCVRSLCSDARVTGKDADRSG